MPETTLVKKLGIKPGQRLLLLHAPDGYREQLGALPEGIEVTAAAERAPDGVFDAAHLFVGNKAELDRLAPVAIAALSPGGLLWIAYPKKSAKTGADITRDDGWDVIVAAGLRPVTQIAIDDTWSALRFRPVADVISTSTRTWGENNGGHEYGHDPS
jgi:hypothetical protein